MPYSDWVRMNNAMRCHENCTVHLPILYPCIFINALSFPAFTFYLTAAYCGVRYHNINAWNSFRGYNRALASEELLRLFILIYICGAFVSSVKLLRRR